MQEGKNKDMVRCGDLLITHFAVFDLSKVQAISLTVTSRNTVYLFGNEITQKEAFKIAEHWAEWKKEQLTGGPIAGVYSAAENILDSMLRTRQTEGA